MLASSMMALHTPPSNVLPRLEFGSLRHTLALPLRVAHRPRQHYCGSGLPARRNGRQAGSTNIAALRAPRLTPLLICIADDRCNGLVYLGIQLCHGGFACKDTAVQSVQQLDEARGKRFREIIPLAQGRPELGSDGRGIW